jgi:hypothetical protein
MRTGIDYCGHFRLYQEREEENSHLRHTLIFVCFVRETLHPEVDALTTATFIGALSR